MQRDEGEREPEETRQFYGTIPLTPVDARTFMSPPITRRQATSVPHSVDEGSNRNRSSTPIRGDQGYVNPVMGPLPPFVTERRRSDRDTIVDRQNNQTHHDDAEGTICMARQEGQLYIDQMVAMLSRESPNDVGQLLRDTRSLAEHWGVQFPNETVVTDMREEINLNSLIERDSESTSGTSSPNTVEAGLRNVEASIQRYRDVRTSTRNMASNVENVMSLSRNE